MRTVAVAAIRAARLERPARMVQRALRSADARQNARDEERLRLLLSVLLLPDSNVIDVGAHTGGFLREVLARAPRGTHLAVEPLPDFADSLRVSFPTVRVVDCALSNTRGRRSFARIPSFPARSGFLASGDHPASEIAVEVRLLDDIAETPADLVKIDVEGAELEVLQGAAGTLEAHRPFVVMEHGRWARELYGVDSAVLHDYMAGFGYAFVDMDGRRYTAQELRHAERWNFLLVPRDRVQLLAETDAGRRLRG